MSDQGVLWRGVQRSRLVGAQDGLQGGGGGQLARKMKGRDGVMKCLKEK